MFIGLWFTVGDLMANPDNIPGFDTYWHITLIDEASDRLLAGEAIGPISESLNAGRPYLYDTDATYPQFAYWVTALVGAFVSNSGMAYALVLFAALLVAQLSFYFGFRSSFGILAALIGAVAYGYAPFVMTNVAPQGRFPALLAVATLPAVIAGILSLLDRPSRGVWVLTILAVGLSVAFHAMVFYIAAIPIGIIALLFGVFSGLGPKRLAFAGSAVVVGILVVWVLLPDGISELSRSGGVAGVAARSSGSGIRAGTGSNAFIAPFSVRANSFDVSLRSFNENYAGIGIAIAAALTLALVRRKNVFIFSSRNRNCIHVVHWLDDTDMGANSVGIES